MRGIASIAGECIDADEAVGDAGIAGAFCCEVVPVDAGEAQPGGTAGAAGTAAYVYDPSSSSTASIDQGQGFLVRLTVSIFGEKGQEKQENNDVRLT